MEVLTLSGPDIFRLWFSPSGRRLLALTGHSGGANQLWNWDVGRRWAVGQHAVVTDREHDNGFPFPSFDQTLRYMLFDDWVLDRKTRKRIKLEFMFTERTLGPDGRVAYALGENRLINRFELNWDFKGKATVLRSDKTRALVQPGEEYADSLVVSPAGDLLVVWTSDGKKLVPFRLSDGEPLSAVELPVFPGDGVRMMMQPYGRLRFSPDGRTLAVAGDGVCLADPLGERPARVLDERYFADLAFTPDGSRLIGVRPDGVVVAWNSTTGAALTTTNLKAMAGTLRAVAVAPDGRKAVVGGSRGRMFWWDL